MFVYGFREGICKKILKRSMNANILKKKKRNISSYRQPRVFNDRSGFILEKKRSNFRLEKCSSHFNENVLKSINNFHQ